MRAPLIKAATALAVVLAGVAGIVIAQRIIVAGCHYGCWIRSTIQSGVLVDTNDRQVHLYIGCGGRLRSNESADEVALTFSYHRFGNGVQEGTCAYSEVTTTLTQPLGHRIVRDAVSGRSVVVLSPARATDPDLRSARPAGPYQVLAPFRKRPASLADELPTLGSVAIAREYQLIPDHELFTLIRSVEAPSFDDAGWKADRQQSTVHNSPARIWRRTDPTPTWVLFWQQDKLSYLLICPADSRPSDQVLIGLADTVTS